MSENELAEAIKAKAKEMQELISKANELDLNVHLTQAMMKNKKGISLYATCKATIYKDVLPIIY